MEHHENNDHSECSICYEPLVNDTFILPCNHIFHTTCMNRWIQESNTCPYCRLDLNIRSTQPQPQRNQETITNNFNYINYIYNYNHIIIY